MCTAKKEKVWIKSFQFFSAYLSLSPCALLNSIKENSSAGGKRGWGFREKQGKEGEDGEGKNLNI